MDKIKLRAVMRTSMRAAIDATLRGFAQCRALAMNLPMKPSRGNGWLVPIPVSQGCALLGERRAAIRVSKRFPERRLCSR